MANPLPNEKELYKQIKNERIALATEAWDLLYHRMGDDLSAINLLCQYYLEAKQPIPMQEARKITLYARHIKDIINKITFTTRSDFYFPEFGDTPLHPALREMLTHYIGNDIYMIMLMVSDSLDPLDPRDILPEIAQKIITHTHSVAEFMERLRLATVPAPNTQAQGETAIFDKAQLSEEGIFIRIRASLAEEFRIKEEKIRFGSSFREDLGLDSVDALRAVMVLEELFGFEIPDDTVDGIQTISQAVEYISQRLNKAK